MIAYLDASAILRLLMGHEWVESLESHLAGRGMLGTSVIGVVETHRGLIQGGAPEDVLTTGDRFLRRMRKIPVTWEVVQTASTIPGRTLRSLDAVHVASAISADAVELVTYDKNMIKAARGVGLRVVSPGMN